jgi:hypothetical protein
MKTATAIKSSIRVTPAGQAFDAGHHEILEESTE